MLLLMQYMPGNKPKSALHLKTITREGKKK